MTLSIINQRSGPDFSIELGLLEQGYRNIAGIDEAGRGSLAGPLAVGFAIYDASVIHNPHTDILSMIDDSKKLSPRSRESALSVINTHAKYVRAGLISHRCVDEHNVNRATEMLIRKLLAESPVTPDIIIIDGKTNFDLGIRSIPVVKGDSKSVTIASASIAAKVRRDHIMDRLDEIYPGYDMKKNKGYGTKYHIETITKSGWSRIHRTSYDPVKSLIMTGEYKP